MDIKKRGRGPGKRPAMFNTSIRLPVSVVDYFNTYYPHTKQLVMREILTNFINVKGKRDGNETKPEKINGGADSQRIDTEPKQEPR